MADYCPNCERPYDEGAVVTRRGSVSLTGNILHWAETSVRLSRKKMQLMRLLLRTGVASHDVLAMEFEDDDQVDEIRHVLRVHIFQLRRLLRPLNPPFEISNNFGFGYELRMLAAEPITERNGQ